MYVDVNMSPLYMETSPNGDTEIRSVSVLFSLDSTETDSDSPTGLKVLLLSLHEPIPFNRVLYSPSLLCIVSGTDSPLSY